MMHCCACSGEGQRGRAVGKGSGVRQWCKAVGKGSGVRQWCKAVAKGSGVVQWCSSLMPPVMLLVKVTCAMRQG